MAANDLLQRLGIAHPILLAPMAGSGGTPELAAAVSSGRLGRLGRRLCEARRDRLSDPPHPQPHRPSFQHQFCLPAATRPTATIDPRPMLDTWGEAHAALVCRRRNCRRCRAIRSTRNWKPCWRSVRRYSASPSAFRRRRRWRRSRPCGIAVGGRRNDGGGGAPLGASGRRCDRRPGRRGRCASRQFRRAVCGVHGTAWDARPRHLRHHRAAGDCLGRLDGWPRYRCRS